MNTSIFVAQILAIVYLSIGLGVLLNPKHYQKAFKEMMNSTPTMYLGGLMATVIGFLLIKHHNHWVQDWTVLVTFIGWAALIKGVSLLAFPEQFLSMFEGWFKKGVIKIGFAIIILGGVFAYFGFFA